MKIRIVTMAAVIASAISGSVPRAHSDDKPAPAAALPDIVGAIKATPGCLGVETARTASGKQVIFAWFENKAAVLKWYGSDTHQKLMKQFFPDYNYHKPLKDVADDSGPIMAIASITLAAKPRFKETSLPISQIAIELYQPVTGGIYLGGRFAPDSLKVPKMRDYTPKEKETKNGPGK
jgi:hypothetical protein